MRSVVDEGKARVVCAHDDTEMEHCEDLPNSEPADRPPDQELPEPSNRAHLYRRTLSHDSKTANKLAPMSLTDAKLDMCDSPIALVKFWPACIANHIFCAFAICRLLKLPTS